jgi:hypothetical protein
MVLGAPVSCGRRSDVLEFFTVYQTARSPEAGGRASQILALVSEHEIIGKVTVFVAALAPGDRSL